MLTGSDSFLRSNDEGGDSLVKTLGLLRLRYRLCRLSFRAPKKRCSKLGKRGTIQSSRHTVDARYPRPRHNQ